MKEFDSDEAKEYLQRRAEQLKEQYEEERKKLLGSVIAILRNEFKDSSIEVFLVGSIIQPFNFTPRSDVDIVLKNFEGDRFALWAKLEKKIGRTIELIPFETCNFQEFVLKDGLKVF